VKTDKTNFIAYSDVENIGNYSNSESLDTYRNERLFRNQSLITFIEHLYIQPKELKVVEIGSGSSALLYAMEKKGLLLEGVGIEPSLSRYKFAEKWKQEGGFSKINNINDEFKNVKLFKDYYDLFLVVDNTFSYLYPENEYYPNQLLKQANNCCKKNGRLIIELINYLPFIHEKEREIITNLPKSNPYSYAIHKKTYCNKKKILKSKATYFTESGRKDSKTELSYVYSKEMIKEKLKKNKFSDIEFFSDYNFTTYHEDKSKKLVVFSRKL